MTSETTSIFDCRPVVQLAELDSPIQNGPRVEEANSPFEKPFLTRKTDLFVAEQILRRFYSTRLSHERISSRVNRAVRFYIRRTLVRGVRAEE